MKTQLPTPRRSARWASEAQKISAHWQNIAAAVTDGVQAAANELLIYGDIGHGYLEEGITGRSVREWLDSRRGQEVSVRINSPGGDVFEGVAIYNALAEHDGRVKIRIDALAASAASVVMMAGDEIEIAANAMVMIHNAWTWTAGNAADLEKEAAVLRQVDQIIITTYAARTNQTPEEIKAMLDAETWFTADEAKAKGFVDSITAAKAPPAPPSPEPDPASVEARRAQFAALTQRAAKLRR